MRTYEYNGKLFKFADDKVPEGAVLHTKAVVKADAVKTEEPKTVEKKAKKATANKSRKAGANK